MRCVYRSRPTDDGYPRPPYPVRANVTFVAVMPTMTKETFQTDRYKAIVHNTIVEMIGPMTSPIVYVRVRKAVAPSPKPLPKKRPVVRRAPPPPLPRQCTIASARQGLVVHTVVEFDMSERDPISCFLHMFRASRTRSFAAPHWLQNSYGRATGVDRVLADAIWMSAAFPAGL